MGIGTFAGGIPVNMNVDTWASLSPEQQDLFYREGAKAAADVAIEFAAEDDEAIMEPGDHDLTVTAPADDLTAAYDAFAQTEIDRMLELAEQRDIENAKELLDTYLALLTKWEGIADEIGNDRDAFAQRIYEEAMPSVN